MQLSKGGSKGGNSRDQYTPPSYDRVAEFHTNADTDSDTAAYHHTIGPQSNQATGGDHTHDGGTSAPLFQGKTISGVRGSAAYYQSVEALLQQLGASSTATG